MTRIPAAADRTVRDPVPLRWTEPSSDGLETWLTDTPVEAEQTRRAAFFLEGRLVEGTITSRMTIVRAERAGAGVVCEIRFGKGVAQTDETTPPVLEFVTSLPDVFAADVPSDGDAHEDRADGDTPGDRARGMLPTGTVRFCVHEPNQRPRGVVLHFASLGGAEYEEPLVETLRDRGWLVLSGRRGALGGAERDGVSGRTERC